MRSRYRSFFWPAVLILAGLIALLVNTGVISTDRLYLLFDLWPVILVVIGLEIIVRRTWQGAQADLAGALIVILAIAGSVAYVALAPSGGEHTVDLSVSSFSGIDKGSMSIDAGVANIDISGGDLGDELFTAHVTYTGPQPTMVSSNGDVTISQGPRNSPALQSQRLTMTVRLNEILDWRVTINSAATTDHLDFSAIKLSAVDLNTAAGHDDLTLGSPTGIVPVTFNGAAMTVNVHRASGIPVSIAVNGAGITLNADGVHRTAIGELNYETSDFAGAKDAYKIEVDGAACTVTLDSTHASD
ncbi:MAG TPA: DUF5668 domain-containing protein [Candidatus Dormibacteraeota bacterium]|nr:DUF5668 domain-containing protein [Candidatus Dormibacteraeota bacterium]